MKSKQINICFRRSDKHHQTGAWVMLCFTPNAINTQHPNTMPLAGSNKDVAFSEVTEEDNKLQVLAERLPSYCYTQTCRVCIMEGMFRFFLSGTKVPQVTSTWSACKARMSIMQTPPHLIHQNTHFLAETCSSTAKCNNMWCFVQYQLLRASNVHLL